MQITSQAVLTGQARGRGSTGGRCATGVIWSHYPAAFFAASIVSCAAGPESRIGTCTVHSFVREEGANEDGHLRGGRGSNPRGSTD